MQYSYQYASGYQGLEQFVTLVSEPDDPVLDFLWLPDTDNAECSG